MIFTCFAEVKFQLRKDTQATKVLFAVADTRMNEPTMYEQVTKHYYKPVLRDLTSYGNKENFETSLVVFLKHDVVHVTDDIVLDRIVTYSSYYGEEDGKDEYWDRFKSFIDSFVRRNSVERKSRVVLFVTEMPGSILEHLYNLQHTYVILVISQYSLLTTNKIMEKVFRPFSLNRKPLIPLHKELLNKIKNPNFDWLESIESQRNTSCLNGKTIVIMLPDVNMFYYQYHFINLLVQLEDYLIIANKQSVHFKIFGTYYLSHSFNDNIPALKLKHHYTNVIPRQLTSDDILTRESDQVYFVAYFSNSQLVNDLTNKLQRRKLLFSGVEMNFEQYRAPYRTKNTIHSNYIDVDTNQAVQYIVDSVIEVGCNYN